MGSETNLVQQIRLACSNGPTRLFRNNTGMGWVGTIIKQTPELLVLRNYRPLHAGLVEGGSDLIGWTDVGNAAIFTALECKAKRGRLSDEQGNFLNQVRAAGGISACVRSVEEALAALGR